ncbi:hypothetical protein [Desulfotomaculum copahuensis]|uniref:hypothetical protein n=1 Tax=Desulfotomaculum copahuensis TaxID=1838280 RepID=UPI000B1CEC3B|nr:hypothetical protein [Desulfotomaculum copahuensis]
MESRAIRVDNLFSDKATEINLFLICSVVSQLLMEEYLNFAVEEVKVKRLI